MHKLGAHQILASSMMDWSDCLGLGYEAGTGKTMCVLDYLYRAVEKGTVSRALVVCPASMVGTWERAVSQVSEFEGHTDEGAAALKPCVTIVSFQRTYRTERVESKHRDGTVTQRKRTVIRPELDHPWDVMVVDESHCIGAHDSVQTNACIALGRLAGKRIALSGTPVSGGGGKQDWKKLYGQVRYLSLDAEFRTWTEFKRRYVRSVDPWGKPATYDEDACRALFRKYFIFARLRDCYDMPDATETDVYLDLAEKKAYKDIKAERLEPYGLTIDNAGGAWLKLLQLCSGRVKRSDGSVLALKTAKLDALRDIVTGSDDKIAVFCVYRASIDMVAAALSEIGETVVYDGRSSSETWRDFQAGSARFLVCQYQAGGVGIDLYASATMILFEPCLSSLILEQTKARIMRKGQTRKCRYVYLITADTIEDKVWRTVRQGMDVTRRMLDEWARE